MKIFILFTIISICFVNCEEEFGQRISKSATKTNSTNATESVKSEKKDLDTHESYRTYEYALAPIEVQTHYPKVIAEEHTLHELPAPLTQALPLNEPIILTDTSGNYGPTAKSLYGAQRMPKHYGSDIPLYRDDPKDQLKGYLPVQLPPALPMESLSQYKPDISDELEAQVKPVAYASAHITPPHVLHVEHEHRGYEPYNAYTSEGHRGYGPSTDHYIPGIPGTPWKDYPLYNAIPYTNFKCNHSPGYYADIEAGCQVWHYCQLDGRHDRFLCSNGTLFNQKTRVCDWWYNVDCHSSVLNYGINQDLYRVHNKYLPSVNPINHLEIPLDQSQPPFDYHRLTSDLQNSGHGLLYAESQTVPQKLLIKRVRKVRHNSNNTTESGLDQNKTNTKFTTKTDN